MYMLRIFPKMTDTTTGRPALEVASENLEEILDWQREVELARKKVETLQMDILKHEKLKMQESRSRRIALEMSDLVVYCRPVPFVIESEWITWF